MGSNTKSNIWTKEYIEFGKGVFKQDFWGKTTWFSRKPYTVNPFYDNSVSLLDFNLITAYFKNFMGWCSLYMAGFIKFLILFLILTIVIASITLIERKILSLTQRRVGPNYIGYKGRLQFIADALKMLLKHITVLSKTNRVLFLLSPVLVCTIIYLFWANLLWGPSQALLEVEYNLVVVGLISSTYSILIAIVGFTSRNKYASLSSARVILVGLTLEILITFMIVIVAMMSENLSLCVQARGQALGVIGALLFIPLCPIMIATFLLETGRLPFDFAEAESELISGYSTEYSGFFFALFYLGEYFHLFCFSVIYAICLFGG